MIGVFLQGAVASTLLVVQHPDVIAGHQETARALWPAGEVVVRAGVAVEVPRFELQDTTLVWVTAHGTAIREVDDPAAAILLMRSWSASPELAGWLVAEKPPDAAVPDAPAHVGKRRPRLLDDVHGGVMLRAGVPFAHAGSTLAWSLGIAQGWLRVEVLGGGRNQLARGTAAGESLTGAVLVGWSPPGLDDTLRPTVSVGAEVQWLDARLDVLGQPLVAVGAEIRGRAVGLVVRAESGISANPFVRLAAGPRVHF